MTKCEPGSEIYTDCINALKAIEEIDQLTLDDARIAGNTSDPAVGRGQQAGGHQRHGGRQSNLVSVPHLVGITHLVGVTHPCMTTPWRRQVRQQMRCVWTLVMTWAPWHTMTWVHPIHLPMGTHLSPHP